MLRVLTALVGVPLFLGVNFLLHPLFFAALMALGAVAGLLEFYGLARRAGVRCYRGLGVAFGLLIFTVVVLYPADAAIVTALCILTIPLVALGKGAPPQEAIREITLTPFGLLFVALPMGFLTLVRMEPRGAYLVLYLLGVIWASDTGAYYAGKTLGRRKLAPLVSPGKTVEGTIGGTLLSVAAAGALGLWPEKLFELPEALLLGLLLSVAGQVGDLTESLIKRWSGAKDSSGLFPGHGGFLDRFDSLLFAAPVLYLYLRMRA